MTPNAHTGQGRAATAFHRVADAFDVVARVVAGAGLIGMVVVITLQVLFRYFLDESLAWTEEISRFLFIATSFIAITVAHRRQMHAGYSSLVAKLPIAVRRTIIIGVDLISIAFFVVVGVASRNLIQIGFESQAPATGLPMGWIYLVFPVFAVLGIVFSIDHIVIHLTGGADELVSADEDRAVEAEAAGAIGDGHTDGRSAS